MIDDFYNRLEQMSREVCRRLGLSEVNFQKYIPLVEKQLIKQECHKVFQLDRDGELFQETEESVMPGCLSDDDESVMDCTWNPLNF
jgi:hypothetical protein